MSIPYTKLHSLTVLAGADIEAARFATIDGRHAATAAQAVGITESAAARYKAVSVVTLYSAPVEAAEPIPFGSPVKPATDGSGRAAVGSAGDHCGRALTEAGAAGALLTVRFIEVGGSAAPTPTDPPVNTVAPAITGTTTEGQVLTVSTGTWTGTPTGYTRQWRRNGVAIAGATGTTYTLVTADVGTVITCTVTATNAGGATAVTTAATAAIAAAGGGAVAPANTVVPAISGTPTEGQVLTVSNGTWTGSPTAYARQWLRGGVAIAGATGATYTLVTADVGATISCTVTASNSAGAASATSGGVGPVAAATVAAPTNSVLPAITGTPQVGQVLTVSNGTWTGSPTAYARQWLRGGVAIAGATGSTYTLVTADLGAAISCTVTATNAGGSAAATSAATSAVTAAAADSRARFGAGSATAGVSSPAALLAAMTAMTGSANASKAGSFTVNPSAGQYGWAAFEAGVSAAGVTFTDALGTGGWQGASSAGNNAADDGSSPNTSTVTFTDATGVTWRFFRQSYAAASGSFTTA